MLLTLKMLGPEATSGVSPPQHTSELVLALSDEERGGNHRFQRRHIRSIQTGELHLKYETARGMAGRNHPAELAAVAPKGSAFAYDVMAEVLRLRYVDLRQREEIRVRLAVRGVAASAGSVSNLSRQALACLEQAHEAAAAKLAARYREEAFILQLDGTREGGEWSHFVIREGFSGNVLLAAKIRSEHSADIAALLRRIKALFGVPDAIISDMSQAIALAAREVFDDVPHLVCHFHFLKDVGAALLGSEHDGLAHVTRHMRKELGKLRRDCVGQLRGGDNRQRWLISMIDRVNAYNADLTGEGFPFDLPHLAYHHRCLEVLPRAEAILRSMQAGPGDPLFDRLVTLRTLLCHHASSGVLIRGVARMEKLAVIFRRLRDILHPLSRDRRAPLNWGRIDDPQDVADMAAEIAALRRDATRMHARTSLCPGDRKAWKTLHSHLEKYADKLNPVLEVRGRLFLLPRTNNLSETRFRDIKRRQRRTTGNGNLGRQFDDMPAQVFYVENLHDPNYRTEALADKPLHECLAKADWNAVRKAVAAMASPSCHGAIDHELINRPDFFAAVAVALSQESVAAVA